MGVKMLTAKQLVVIGAPAAEFHRLRPEAARR
jgi:hypothetical protein